MLQLFLGNPETFPLRRAAGTVQSASNVTKGRKIVESWFDTMQQQETFMFAQTVQNSSGATYRPIWWVPECLLRVWNGRGEKLSLSSMWRLSLHDAHMDNYLKRCECVCVCVCACTYALYTHSHARKHNKHTYIHKFNCSLL